LEPPDFEPPEDPPPERWIEPLPPELPPSCLRTRRDGEAGPLPDADFETPESVDRRTRRVPAYSVEEAGDSALPMPVPAARPEPMSVKPADPLSRVWTVSRRLKGRR